jgi:hypothetical protein
MELLELDDMCCRVILDVQGKRFTRERRWLFASSAYPRHNQAAGQTLLTRWAGWLDSRLTTSSRRRAPSPTRYDLHSRLQWVGSPHGD